MDLDYGKMVVEIFYEWKVNFVNCLWFDIFFEDMLEVVVFVDFLIFVFMLCDEIIWEWIVF